ncbi:MAG: hypothetical protein HYT16_04480 [DPANN group archaeon]|nr:hypothetical protein [DPANN group archaeon]
MDAGEEIKRQQETELQKQQIKAKLQQFMTREAMERLAFVKAGHPELAEQIEALLIQSANAGQLQGKITEEQIKNLLERVGRTKKTFRIIK